MRRYLIGAVLGIVLTIVGLLVVAGILVKVLSNKKPAVPENAVLVLNLDGNVPEVAPVDVDLPFVQSGGEPTIRDLWVELRAAAKDSHVKAIALKPHSLTVGWAKLEEIRAGLLQFKKSGKPVYAYLQTPGMHEYFLASVADRIYVSPDDYLEVKGFRLESTYVKGTLDKLGIGFDVDHIGKYKDAGDTLTRTSMTPETREVLNGILDQISGSFNAAVAAGRKKQASDIPALLDQGPFLAVEAKQAGLVDDLGYESQMYRDLTGRVKADELPKISYKNYLQAGTASGAKIAFLTGEGDILRGKLDQPFGQNNAIASETFAKSIEQVRKDKSIKGVILRVNSPGGDAVASDEMLYELQRLASEKPLVISMSDLAASGGYFISMTGSPIVAYPDTITGSIGVIYGKPNFRGLYDKIGISKDLLSRGKFANIDSDYTPLSPPERQKLHDGIASTYRSFVTKVATARKRSYDQIDQVAQGRVWMGEAASKQGLVDRVGTLDTAFELVRQKAGLTGNAEVDLVPFPGRRGLLDSIISGNSEAFTQVRSPDYLKALTRDLPSPAMLRGGILEIMPVQVSVY